ncbi:alpha/beta-hydrolase [Hyaloscypha hepaticicola]|uniref:Alpha/beta-hydrolase n=1 Tax=Hyaloscypha hepaticicola TaxID=2082293 RepID=A0A2J6QIG8_9HELO|nr:alpha/beta-hydrolase [Hyaloscypha hepaticicola]
MDLLIFLLITLVSGVLPAQGATGPLVPVDKSCFNVTIPVTVTSTNFIYGLPKFSDNLDITALTIELNTRGVFASLNPFAGTQNETATYHVSGTFCGPSSNKASTLLLATHGASLDRYYWDFQYEPSCYSFVDFAVSKGYSVFYYDRVGAGESSLLSGYVAQIPINVGVLEQLTNYIRSGSLSLAGNKYKPNKIVLLGHSVGSIISNALLVTNPTIADGAVLTGWSPNSGLLAAIPCIFAGIQAKIAKTVNPARWGAYDNGWFTVIDIYAYIELFYKIGSFDFTAVQFALNTSWPIGIMEFLTIYVQGFVSQSTIPVLFQVGSNDAIICQGNCSGVFTNVVGLLFPKSASLEAYIQPNTGHILTTALNATGGFQVITDYLHKNGF